MVSVSGDQILGLLDGQRGVLLLSFGWVGRCPYTRLPFRFCRLTSLLLGTCIVDMPIPFVG